MSTSTVMPLDYAVLAAAVYDDNRGNPGNQTLLPAGWTPFLTGPSDTSHQQKKSLILIRKSEKSIGNGQQDNPTEFL